MVLLYNVRHEQRDTPLPPNRQHHLPLSRLLPGFCSSKLRLPRHPCLIFFTQHPTLLTRHIRPRAPLRLLVLPPPSEFRLHPSRAHVRRAVHDLHRNEMTGALEHVLAYAAFRDAAGATSADPGLRFTRRAQRRRGQRGLGGVEVQHAGAHEGQFVEGGGRGGVVEGRDGGVGEVDVRVRDGVRTAGGIRERGGGEVGQRDFGRAGGFRGGRVERGGEIAQAVRDPALEYARIPGLVEFGALEGFAGGGAAGPAIAPFRRHGREAEVFLVAHVVLDDRVEEDERGEEPRVHEREVDDVVAAHTMPDPDDGPLHLRAEMVDHKEEIARVVQPGC
nr:hypothetical protein CFP56_68383 [Quercus suber]